MKTSFMDSHYFLWKKIRILAVMVLLSALLCLGACQSFKRTSRALAIPEGTVVFSFDDGPNIHENTTARLLDVLKKHEIQVMFALLGENVRQNPELVRRIQEEGHVIINHGYSDHFTVWMGDKAFYTNLLQGETAITAVLGEEAEPKLFRPQGGFYTKRQERIWQDAGYTLVPGTIRIYDAVLSADDRDRALKTLIKLIEKQKGGIILLHDARDSHSRMEARLVKAPQGVFNRSWIPEIVETLIVFLDEKGYKLRGFDTLIMLGYTGQ
jgi:peptidoglycan/xylan/chitin deacetylase (PgdA/CDA1 family)